MGRAAREAPAALRDGRVVVLASDQDALERGVFVPFLGRPASTFRGPARLALRHDVPLFFGVLVREGQGYRMVLERVEAGPGADADPETRLTRAWVERLEDHVGRRPEQYFWFHRRWKTEPPGG